MTGWLILGGYLVGVPVSFRVMLGWCCRAAVARGRAWSPADDAAVAFIDAFWWPVALPVAWWVHLTDDDSILGVPPYRPGGDRDTR